MMRRGIAAVGFLIVLIVLILGVRSCLDTRKKNAIKNYSKGAVELLHASKLEGDSLFKLLQSKGGTGAVVTIRNSLNGYRVESSELVDRARRLDVPGETSTAQRYLLDVLELRRDGLAIVADAMQTALGDQNRREGTTRITGAMQILLASDTIDRVRFRPTLNKVLDDNSLPHPDYPKGNFVPDVQWLNASFVANQINALRSGTGRAGGPAAPGLHGDGIAAVSLGGTTLTPGGSASVRLTSNLAFQIQVQNQGQNTETDVNVKVTVGQGSSAFTLEKPISTIAAGEIKTVTIPLSQQPPTGQNAPVKVEVATVPGEKKTDNNVQQFSVIFTR